MLLNSLSLLQSKFMTITLAPWFQCDAMDGRANFNLCFKKPFCVSLIGLKALLPHREICMMLFYRARYF